MTGLGGEKTADWEEKAAAGGGPGGGAGADGRGTTTAYAFTSVSNESGEDHYGNLGSSDSCVHLEDGMHHPWLLAGMTQLGIPYVDAESGTDEFFYAP